MKTPYTPGPYFCPMLTTSRRLRCVCHKARRKSVRLFIAFLSALLGPSYAEGWKADQRFLASIETWEVRL